MKILIFAFAGTVAEKTARFLDCETRVNLQSSEKAIASFIGSTEFTKYDLVLGLGVYSGKDQDKLRIETECTSQFRNNKTGLERMAIPYTLQPTAAIKLANGIGNSWCNLVSYEILKKSLSTSYTFIHIPNNFSSEHAANIIAESGNITLAYS